MLKENSEFLGIKSSTLMRSQFEDSLGGSSTVSPSSGVESLSSELEDESLSDSSLEESRDLFFFLAFALSDRFSSAALLFPGSWRLPRERRTFRWFN